MLEVKILWPKTHKKDIHKATTAKQFDDDTVCTTWSCGVQCTMCILTDKRVATIFDEPQKLAAGFI